MTTSDHARRKREKEAYEREAREREERRKQEEIMRQRQAKEADQRRWTERAIQLQKEKREKDIAASQETGRQYIREMEEKKNKNENV